MGNFSRLLVVWSFKYYGDAITLAFNREGGRIRHSLISGTAAHYPDHSYHSLSIVLSTLIPLYYSSTSLAHHFSPSFLSIISLHHFSPSFLSIISLHHFSPSFLTVISHPTKFFCGH
jgi:hypothetical protein